MNEISGKTEKTEKTEKRIIKTQIDGIPVELTIHKLGPATNSEVRNIASSLNAEDQNFQITNKNNMSKSDVQKVEQKIKDIEQQSNGSEEIFEYLLDLYNEVQINNDKDWWKSKTIWVNVAAIVAILGSFFGLNLNIPPETLVTLAGVIMPLINIWLRKGTDRKLKPMSQTQMPRILKMPSQDKK